MKHEIGARAPHSPRRDSTAGHNAALLIDFDNVTMGIRSDLQAQLRKLLNTDLIKGKVAVQRAYADWRRYPQYIVPLSEASIDLIFAPAFGSNKKNATDIRLAIDALELVFTRPEIGTFILLSGDSDFSALVLKLKEYGKYVVGVGIRESASDLLVQNCDEYYSYSELTGLSKEAEPESLPRDPWETVVQAVVRMRSDNDVMRSDRLKQVMQEIDPHFNEKDAGFNKFSKFVAEATRRRLLITAKMENGQYEVDLGPEANVPLSEGATVAVEAPPTEPKPRRKRPRSPVAEVAGATGMTLAHAFSLLRQALTDLGAVGEAETDVEQVKARVSELADNEDDPVFESKRFQRLLRQAHDASVIELVKTDEDEYRLKLGAKAASTEEAPAAERDDVPAEVEPKEEKKAVKKTTRAKRKRTATKTTKATKTERAKSTKTTGEEAETEPEATPPKEPVPESESAPRAEAPKLRGRFRAGSRGGAAKSRGEIAEESDTEVPGSEEGEAARPSKPKEPIRTSLRGRKGSRGRKPATEAEPDEPAARDEPPSATVAPVADEVVAGPAKPTAKTPHTSVRGRGGSRRVRRSVGSEEASPAEELASVHATEAKAEPEKRSEAIASTADEAAPIEGKAVRGDGAAAGASSKRQPEPEPSRAASEARPKASPPASPGVGGAAAAAAGAGEAAAKPESADSEQESGGLFKRMAVAFQRAVLGQEEDSEN